MPINMERTDLAQECTQHNGQLSQECWSFDKGLTIKTTSGTSTGVLNFDQHNIYNTADDKDLRFPGRHVIDPGFSPKVKESYIKIDGQVYPLPEKHQIDPGFGPKESDRHIKIDGQDFVFPRSYDIDPGYSPDSERSQKLKDLSPPLLHSHDSTVQRLEQAILDGNQKEIESIMRGNASNPQALRNVIVAVNHDLGPSGVHVRFNVGSTMTGNDKEFHAVGTLSVSRDGADTDVEFSTDARIQTTVGSRGTALIADPARELKAIGNSAARHGH